MHFKLTGRRQSSSLDGFLENNFNLWGKTENVEVGKKPHKNPKMIIILRNEKRTPENIKIIRKRSCLHKVMSLRNNFILPLNSLTGYTNPL